MKIAVSAKGKGLDAPVSQVFGRCPVFVLVDTETMSATSFSNEAVARSSGAGIQAAQFIVDQGVQGVITGNVGPNAHRVLDAAGIQIYRAMNGTVREAVQSLVQNALPLIGGPSTAAHSGLRAHARRQSTSAWAGQATRTKSRSSRQVVERGKPDLLIAVSAADHRGLDGIVSLHFGRCPYFVLADIIDGEVARVQTIENPYQDAHGPGQVPQYIQGLGVDVLITGGVGNRALAMFEEFGIQVATGAEGTVGRAIQAYLSGSLSETEPCRESALHELAEEEQSFQQGEINKMREELDLLKRQLGEIARKLDDLASR